MVSTTVLDSGTQGSASSKVTNSVTPVANTMTIVAVYSQYGSAGGHIPTVSGDSITWAQISNEQTASPGGYNMVTLFGGVSATPSAGALTIDFAGQTQQTISWAVIQLNKADASGTNGANAFVQAAVNNYNGIASGLTVTLGAFSNTNNATLGIFGTDSDQSYTTGSGFSSVVHVNKLFVEFQATNNTSVAAGWSNGANAAVGIGLEIKALNTSGFFTFL
jgi:hypothetical protein